MVMESGWSSLVGWNNGMIVLLVIVGLYYRIIGYIQINCIVDIVCCVYIC